MAGTQTCYLPNGSEATEDIPSQSLSVNDVILEMYAQVAITAIIEQSQ